MSDSLVRDVTQWVTRNKLKGGEVLTWERGNTLRHAEPPRHAPCLYALRRARLIHAHKRALTGVRRRPQLPGVAAVSSHKKKLAAAGLNGGTHAEIVSHPLLPPVLSLQRSSTSGAAASRPAWPTSGRALSPHNSRWAGTVQHGSGGAGEHEWHARGRSCAVRPCKSRDCCGARCAPGQRRASCATWPTAVPAALVPPLRSPHRAGRPAAVPVQIIHSRMYAQVRLGNG